MTRVIDDLKSDGGLWTSINWKKVNQIVNRLQVRIVKAERLLLGA